MMDERIRADLQGVATRFMAVVARLGVVDLHLVAVEVDPDNAAGVESPPPRPFHLEKAPLLTWRHVVYMGHRFGLWYFGEPGALRSWDSLCYRIGEIGRRTDENMLKIDPDGHPHLDWVAVNWWPLKMIDVLTQEECIHLIRRVDAPDIGAEAKAVWLADDVFSLSAVTLNTLAYPWAACSQAEVAEFIGVTNRSGLLKDLDGDGRIDHQRTGRTTARVRFIDQAEHFRFLDWLNKHRANQK